METVNEQLRDADVGHQVDLQRYSNHVVQRIIALLNRADPELVQKLNDALERLAPEDFTIERLDALLKSVRELNRSAYEAIGRELTKELQDLAEYEAGFQFQLFRSVLPVEVSFAKVSVEAAYSAAMSRPFQISKDRAISLSDYLVGLTEDRAAMVRDAVRLGYIEGESISQIVRRIKGTKKQNYEDGLMAAPRHKVEAMVRTAINHTATVARQEFYKGNQDLIKGWQFLATLDSRTSITCASLSGNIYPIGKGPMPPRHINCRSTSVPVLKSWKELGGADIEDFQPATRASMDGQVPADITFTEWLRKKPASFQDQVLGATRGKLFRANEIEVDRFTNNKGIVYSLGELRKRDAELFERAGL